MSDERERQDLRARTTAFALRFLKMASALPKSQIARTLGGQVLRSGTSVGANYREAYRARSTAEFISKLGDCLLELEETAYWLELLSVAEIVKPARLRDLRRECDELLAIFTTISKNAKCG